jgi:hypothetical protein
LSKRSPTTLPAYDPDRLDRILALLSRAGDDSPDIALAWLRDRRDELERDLLSLIHATGLAHDGSEAGAIWHEAVSDAPSHQQLAAAFTAMARAARPLDPGICKSELRSGLSALIHTRWAPRWKRERRNAEPSLRTLDWGMLSIAERQEIRAMARHLAQYHDGFVRRGRQQKGNLDAVLTGLADLFLRYSGSSIDRYEVAYARESQFIKFAVLALEPAAVQQMSHEVTDYALSRRWERLVVNSRKPAQPISKKPKKKKLLPP